MEKGGVQYNRENVKYCQCLCLIVPPFCVRFGYTISQIEWVHTHIGGAEEIIKSELNYSQLCGKIISDNKSISDKILIYILSVQEERNVIDGHIPIECGAYTID